MDSAEARARRFRLSQVLHRVGMRRAAVPRNSQQTVERRFVFMGRLPMLRAPGLDSGNPRPKEADSPLIESGQPSPSRSLGVAPEEYAITPA